MQSVRWLSFCVSNSLTRTVVHFFPSEGSVTAPYQASCQLTLFGERSAEKRVMLEGARLSSPDGVRIEDAFPIVAEEGNGFFGLVVEISTMQPRVDLSGSSVVIELQSRGQSAKFWPRFLGTQLIGEPANVGSQISSQISSRCAALPACKDPFSSCSVLAVNAAQLEHRIELFARAAGSSTESGNTVAHETGIGLGMVPPHAAVEVNLPGDFFDAVAPTEFEWGLSRARGIYRNAALPPELAYFLLYRDVSSRRIVSVCAI